MQSKPTQKAGEYQRYAAWAYSAVIASSLMCASIFEVSAMTTFCLAIDMVLVGAFVLVAGKIGLWGSVEGKRASARPCPGAPCHGEARS